MLPESPASLFMARGHPLSAPALWPQPPNSAQEVPLSPAPRSLPSGSSPG